MLASDPGTEIVVVHTAERTMPGTGAASFSVHADEEELQGKIE
jgi:hypothetical protein